MTKVSLIKFDKAIIIAMVKAVNVASSPTKVWANEAAAIACAVAKLCIITFAKKVLFIVYCNKELYQ